MKNILYHTIAAIGAGILTFWTAPDTAEACTNILVTRGASADGSNMISYAADWHQL